MLQVMKEVGVPESLMRERYMEVWNKIDLIEDCLFGIQIVLTILVGFILVLFTIMIYCLCKIFKSIGH